MDNKTNLRELLATKKKNVVMLFACLEFVKTEVTLHWYQYALLSFLGLSKVKK